MPSHQVRGNGPPMATSYNVILGSGMVGKTQQLTTTTITITPNTTNQNLRDNAFIVTAGLTPRAAIIKPKVSVGVATAGLS